MTQQEEQPWCPSIEFCNSLIGDGIAADELGRKLLELLPSIADGV